MRIAVNHLTRMQRGYVCVAGVDVNTGEHVRPVLGEERLPTDILARHGGPFDMATVIDLGATEPVPVQPAIEDHEFSPRAARSIETIGPTRFWDTLTELAQPNLAAIFGPELRTRPGGAATVDEGQGRASLGCLAPTGLPELYVKERVGGSGQVRMKVADGVVDLDLGVTDIRLYGADHVTPDLQAVQRVNDEVRAGALVLLSVGLTRPFSASPGALPTHWLQVNNIHLENDPCWRLGSEPGWRRLIRLVFDF